MAGRGGKERGGRRPWRRREGSLSARARGVSGQGQAQDGDMVVGIGSGTANDGRKAHELVSGLIEMEMGWGEDKQVEVAELSRGVSVEWMEAEQRRCFEVDTRGGVAGVFDGAFRIFFDDSLRGSLVFFAGCRSRFEGPKYPGKNMNVYLEPLVDDLVRGWEGRGIRTYDASKKEYFDMYVWYHTSLLPARALFCGWCTHGKWPCPQCRQAVTFFWLNKGGKYSCFDEARQFLERRHAYRSDVKSFKKGRVVRGPKPIPKTGTEIKAELDALQPSPDGNGFLGYGETHQWTHKPCLWKLPYFEFLELPHNIDVMHTEKNISEAIWSTIVDTEKTKDNIKARIDQEMWCDRPELNMQPPNGAKKTWTKPHAPFCLTKAQKREVFQWMKDSLFFPDGFAANWMRGLNIETLRVQGLKSHDYHIWLERIMPTMNKKTRAWMETMQKMKLRMSVPEDLSLLEAFKAGIDLDADGPPPGFIDDYWFAEPDDDEETRGPITDGDTGY
ncbi:hypothetical protein QYE76_037544 [Lolium multiflorum]|uniref:Uncharacterized protein n=1 Tax=Lolium multiflorum TaxID=4521 RepID=A0AAD8QF23_LOLMU|nr:hypothetical protein QYE76_037544 [Lolium multiflorum]